MFNLHLFFLTLIGPFRSLVFPFLSSAQYVYRTRQGIIYPQGKFCQTPLLCSFLKEFSELIYILSRVSWVLSVHEPFLHRKPSTVSPRVTRVCAQSLGSVMLNSNEMIQMRWLGKDDIKVCFWKNCSSFL